jgi:GH25 family lysozyme M1 (1,4-beta-N-acetylmuramidase)
VPGIKGPVDRNAFAGSRAEWQAYLRRQHVIR